MRHGGASRRRVRAVMRLLDRAYGAARPFRPEDPMDVLVRTILSQHTNDLNSDRAFEALKRGYRSWGALLRAEPRAIARAIKGAGLANIKARRIRRTLAGIRDREGALTLSRLSRAEVDDALAYLTSLDGVGPKTAACVLLFGFGKPAMPVDTHIHRVAGRLGLIGPRTGAAGAHGELTRLVPKDLIYGFHLGIILHGRKTCKARSPRCGACVLYRMCAFPSKKRFAARERRKGQ